HQKDAQAGRKKKEQVEGCLGIARPVERETGLQNDLDVEMLPFGVESRQILLRYRIGERLNGKSTLQRQLIVCLQLDRFRPFRPGDLEFSEAVKLQTYDQLTLQRALAVQALAD